MIYITKGYLHILGLAELGFFLCFFVFLQLKVFVIPFIVERKAHTQIDLISCFYSRITKARLGVKAV